MTAEILSYANDWAAAILGLMVVVAGFGVVMLMRRRMTARELAPMLTSAAVSAQPPLPDSRIRCEYCGAEQSRRDTCIQCGRSLSRRQVGMTNSPTQIEVAIADQTVGLASGDSGNENPWNKTRVDLRSYSARRWKVALPVAMLIYAGSIPLVTSGVSDAGLFNLLVIGLIGLFFGGPVALSYGIALFFQARNDESIVSRVMGVALVILVISSIATFEVLSYTSINCNNPSAYWWDWRDFYAKCNFYPPTN